MHEEISKWFLKGIAASPGIIIGKAYVLQDILLMIERRSLEESHAEEEVARLKEAIRRVVDELMKDNLEMSQEDRQEESRDLSHSPRNTSGPLIYHSNRKRYSGEWYQC